MTDGSFRDFVMDQLSGLERVACRSMFGGHGLYQGPTFFGIIHRDRLYFRTDEASRRAYAEFGMEPFRPSEKQTLKSYYEVPAEVVEKRERLLDWARTAIACQPARATAAPSQA